MIKYLVNPMILEDKNCISNSPMLKIFKELKPYQERLPIWDDEFYSESLEGSLTSIGMIKENNHTSEILFHQAEILSVLSGLLGREHFQDEFNKDWKIGKTKKYSDT